MSMRWNSRWGLLTDILAFSVPRFLPGPQLANFAMSRLKQEEEAANAVASLVRRRCGGSPGGPRRGRTGPGPTGGIDDRPDQAHQSAAHCRVAGRSALF